MSDTEHETVVGEVVAERQLSEQESVFRRAVENTLEFRNLDGGVYKLVRVEPPITDTDREVDNAE